MKYITLTKCQKTKVDDKDYEYLSQWNWHFGANGYAVREQHYGMKDGKRVRKTILMHRELLNAPHKIDVDHINEDKLDNRRENIRLATRSQNRANISAVKRKEDLPIGITFNPSPRSKQPYMARVCMNGKSYFLGNFYKLTDAVEAYTAKKRELYGEYAK